MREQLLNEGKKVTNSRQWQALAELMLTLLHYSGVEVLGFSAIFEYLRESF
jgi:hypothetical protein